MISRNDLSNDLMGIFSPLDNIQYQYDWVISDTDLYFSQDAPDEIRKRWSWTGLLMTGQELTRHLTSGHVFFVSGGVLSAIPKGTRQEQVWDYVPCWEIENFGSPDYRFQTPLTQFEIICYDGYAWCIVCEPEMSPKILKAFPQAKTPEEFHRTRSGSFEVSPT